MVYSDVHHCWKLINFGFASLATSKEFITKISYSGAGYRAPEILTTVQCNNEADIFALGCIIYEIVTGDTLFPNQWAIMEYAQQEDKSFPTDRWPQSPPDTPLHALEKLTEALIDLEPAKRPDALMVKTRFDEIYSGALQEIAEEVEVPQLPADGVGLAVMIIWFILFTYYCIGGASVE